MKLKQGQIEAELLLASQNKNTKNTIYTFRLKFPRIILAEFLTHSLISRNTASSRAVPLKKMRQRVLNEVYIPQWTEYQKGMAANNLLSYDITESCNMAYTSLFEDALDTHEFLEKNNVSKQDANRILESWMFIEMVATGTEWKNLLKLRNHDDAQPSFHELASLIEEEIENANPQILDTGEWHIPLIGETEKGKHDITTLLEVSAGRCARVSYFMPDTGLASTVEQNVKLYDRLVEGHHMSPLCHQAVAMPYNYMVGQTVGFMQFRKFIPNEANGDLQADRILTPMEANQLMAPFNPFN